MSPATTPAPDAAKTSAALAVHGVFDHFHVIKLYNEKLSAFRHGSCFTN